MSKPRVIALTVSIVFLFSLVSTVRADSVHTAPGLQKFDLSDATTFSLADIDRDDIRSLLSDHFADNNGKHLGFSVASFHNGVKYGWVNPNNPSLAETPTPNPEPTGMLLLGTGLAGAAAFARRRTRRRRHSRER